MFRLFGKPDGRFDHDDRAALTTIPFNSLLHLIMPGSGKFGSMPVMTAITAAMPAVSGRVKSEPLVQGKLKS